jgi:hypothetical protein
MITLFWNNKKKSTRAINLDRYGSNVATFHLAPGYTNFHAYCTTIERDESSKGNLDPLTTNQLMAIDATFTVSDDEANDNESVKQGSVNDWPQSEDEDQDSLDATPCTFLLDGPLNQEDAPAIIISNVEDQNGDETRLLKYFIYTTTLVIHSILQTPRDGSHWHPSIMTSQMQRTCLFCLSLCKSYQASMATKNSQEPNGNTSSETWPYHFH